MKVDRAIQVVNILRADVDLMVNRRVLIVMEQGAEAKFLSVTMRLMIVISWRHR